MGKVEKKMTEYIKNFEKSVLNINNEEFLKLEEANEIFKELVTKGVIKKKGNNILLPGEMPTKPRDFFNTEKPLININQNSTQSNTKSWFS